MSTRDPVKEKARNAVNNAVRAGKLPRAASVDCVDCGGRAREYDHARGYIGASALDVDAVCRPCHSRRGAARGETCRGDRHPSRQRPERRPRGDMHPMRRRADLRELMQGRSRIGLTADMVRMMRELNAIGFLTTELAAMYGTDQTNVSLIVNRKTWRHVP